MSTSLKLRMISLRSNSNFVQDTSHLELRFAPQCVMQSFENPDSVHDSRLCFLRLRLTCSFSFEFSFLRRSGSVVCALSQKDTLITNVYEPILMHPRVALSVSLKNSGTKGAIDRSYGSCFILLLTRFSSSTIPLQQVQGKLEYSRSTLKRFFSLLKFTDGETV